MRPGKLTEENKEFIKLNRLKMSGNAMAKLFGVGPGVVTRYMAQNGLSISYAQSRIFASQTTTGRTSATPEQDEFIKANYLTMPIKRMETVMGRTQTFIRTRMQQLNLVIPPELTEQRKIDSRIKKGTVPPNKGKKQSEYMSAEAIAKTVATRYKKGNIPGNTFAEDGVISIRTDRHKKRTNGKPYKYIRLKLGVWYPLHQHNWNMKHGKPPKGHCLWCIDGNTLNCEPDNWELITRKENMRRNSIVNLPPELRESINAVAQLNRKINKLKRQYDTEQN